MEGMEAIGVEGSCRESFEKIIFNFLFSFVFKAKNNGTISLNLARTGYPL